MFSTVIDHTRSHASAKDFSTGKAALQLGAKTSFDINPCTCPEKMDLHIQFHIKEKSV